MVSDPARALTDAYARRLEDGHDPVATRALTLLCLARMLCEQLHLGDAALEVSLLSSLAEGADLGFDLMRALDAFGKGASSSQGDAAHRLGHALDVLQASEWEGQRRKTGSYFTPDAVACDLIGRALREPSLDERVRQPLTVCDPACGGGAFVVEAARQLIERGLPAAQVVDGIYGIDLSEVALATTQVALWLLVGDAARPIDFSERFVQGDALWGQSFAGEVVADEALASVEESRRLDFPTKFPDQAERGFDWVVGNPPWIAFQGRATQPITSERRAFYRKHYRAFTGYPTLHGMFIERAAQLAPRGHITLLVPSSLSDLDGYKNARESLRARHTAADVLPEYGQDAFEGVVQPCFGLIARPGVDTRGEPSRPLVLEEKTHARAQALQVPVPEVLTRIDALQPLPKDQFREVGFQSNRVVVAELFHRGHQPPPEFSVPLLEGKNVGEFVERAPRLFMKPDEEVLRRAQVRLREVEVYERVDVVVRQTAAFTIAARHGGLRFRNSLIGAFESDEVSADLLVGLLNSALYRALHVMRQRDARQAAFPQVKLSHLRKLPAPPKGDAGRSAVEEVSREASSAGGLDEADRVSLDAAVFGLFSVTADDAQAIAGFLRERAPAALRATRVGFG